MKGSYDAEAMERSALKRGKNFVRREWTCEPKERVRSKVTPRNLRPRNLLAVRGVPIRVSWGYAKFDGSPY